MKVKCVSCEHEFEVTTEAENVQSELEAKIQELEDAQEKLAASEASLDEVQAKLDAEVKATERFVDLVASEIGIEAAQSALPSLRKMDDETFVIMKSMAAKVEVETEEEVPPDVAPPETFVAADQSPSETTGDSWDVEL